MTANEYYAPAYVGGAIVGVQLQIENPTGSSISALSRNGIYYVYQGHKFQLLDCSGVTIAAGSSEIISKEIPNGQTIPSTDIKLMIDTAGLDGAIITPTILWSV